ncbi:uncharacterized protein A4U43_C06F90 [Asparagus officinalis]|uniref:Glycerol-3-phosphate acyltransferase RAM2/GPAT1-8 HAD-like domain-containing protein n=1 Tax=Asparagus officinalis TaxID=4686 RepID=A0A5P1EIC5_ASPOF|nr:uncharacterized protein A4U43_C06F90 [Asparagus officinalis]
MKRQSRGTTLPMFFLKDSRESTRRVLSRYGRKKYALTCIPRIMVEPFLKDHLGVGHVICTKLRARGGYSMGFVTCRLGIMVGMLGLKASRVIMLMSTRDGINHEEEKEIDVWPTPLNSLAIGLWAPMGILLSTCRILVAKSRGHNSHGSVVYVCNHRTLVDQVFISAAVQRRVSAVTYSLSRLSELISPISTV